MKTLSCHNAKKTYAVILAVLAFSSCSTVRVLQEGQRRLVSNKIKITNNDELPVTEIDPYIKQKAKGWNPFLYVYNWENGKGKGWDKFVHKLGNPPVIFDSTLVESSVSNIKDHLEYLGYYNSHVKYAIDTKAEKKAKVTYYVTTGKRYPLREITYSVPYEPDFTNDFDKDKENSLIRKGDYLSEASLEAETVRSASAMRNSGYYDFSKNFFFFEADTLSIPDSANLRVIVKRHTRNENESVEHNFNRYYFGDVTVSYPEDMRFRQKFLKDLNNLSSGELYREQRVNTTYSRFNSVSLFRSVNVEVTPRDSSNILDCNIALQKGKTQGFKAELEASVNTNGLFGISPEISYYNRNIFRGGEIFNLSVRTNHQFKPQNKDMRSNEVLVTTSLVFPRFIPFSTKRFRGPNLPRSEVKASFNYQNRPEYKRNLFSTSFGYSGTFNRRTFSYQASPIVINYVHVLEVDPEFVKNMTKDGKIDYGLMNSFLDQFDMGIAGTIYYNSAGTVNPKNDYWYARLRLDLSGNLLSLFNSVLPKGKDDQADTYLIFGVPYNQYVLSEFDIGKTFVWGKKDNHALALRYLLGFGYAYGNSKSLPYDKAFFAGGANSLRGWTARAVGPGCAPLETSWTIPNQMGNMKMEANMEYRFPLFWKLAGALFVDAGNIWNVGTPLKKDTRGYFQWDTFGESIAADWGIGLRVDLSFLILRLDYGMKIHDPALEGQKWLGPKQWFKSGNNAFHFGVGYPF